MLQQSNSVFWEGQQGREQKQTLSKKVKVIHSFIIPYLFNSALIKYPLHASCLLAPGDNGHCLMGLKKTIMSPYNKCCDKNKDPEEYRTGACIQTLAIRKASWREWHLK